MLGKVAEVKVLVIATDVPIQAIVAILQPLDVQDQRSLTDRSSWGAC
jgi:hypothetical protein